MTSNEVKLILLEVLGGGVSLNTSALTIVVLGSFLAAVLGAWVASFFGKRGETAAIARDLETIKRNLAQTTAVTEEIKADISGALWLKHKRWDVKWECYAELVENFGEVSALKKEEIAILTRGALPTQDSKAFSGEIAAKRTQIDAAFERTRRFGSKARLAVAPEVRTMLSEFGGKWNAAKTVEEEAALAREAWNEIADVARNDLFGDPRDSSNRKGEG
jgi:hypothetical protein